MMLHIQFDTETDGRWIAEVPSLPGACVYGSTREEAEAKVKTLALRVLADRIENDGFVLHESIEWFITAPVSLDSLDPETRASVERGLEDVKAGRVKRLGTSLLATEEFVDRGSFARYADDASNQLFPFTVTFELDETGFINMSCDQLGVATCGKTLAEACANLAEALELELGGGEPVIEPLDPTKRERLESAGWKVGSAKEFLGLSDDEAESIRLGMEPIDRGSFALLDELTRLSEEADGYPELDATNNDAPDAETSEAPRQPGVNSDER